MPFVNQEAFEKIRRHQQITKYEIYPLQSEDIEGYQVLAENMPSLLSGDVRILQKKAKIPFWAEEKGKVWAKIAKLMTKTPQQLFALSGNPSAESEEDGDDTFEFFDDFEPTSTINTKYITGWTKSGSNPLQDKTCQNWLIAVYSNYNNEDKIYIFEQRNAHPSNNIECWSFTRANAAIPAQWTDHGVVFTGVGAHDDGHIEPHGIIFETQSMADAREGVGEGLGTPKWRMYYCAKGAGEETDKYSANFAYASESDLTSWTAYASNPVYDHDATWGFADSKVCIYDNKVWLHHCRYKPGTSCDSPFFTVSDNGIDNWVDKSLSWAGSMRTVMGTLVSFSSGILATARIPPGDFDVHQCFTNDGNTRATYSGNPVMSGGGVGVWDEDIYWSTIVVDKNGSPDIAGAGTYYMYYIGHATTPTDKLGLATSTTLTEESEELYTLSDKWTQVGAVSTETVADGTLTLIKAGNLVYGYKSQTAVTKPVIVETRFRYLTANIYAAGSSMFWVDGSNYAGEIGNDYDGNIALSKEAGTYTLGSTQITFVNNTWYKMRVNWKTGEVKCYKDSVLQDTITTNVLADATAPVGLILKSGSAAGDIMGEWDFVLARKYASPKPLILQRQISGKADAIRAVVG